jgi:hypothetical protein
MIAATRNFDIKSAFYLSQVFVKLATQIGQATIVGGLENYVPRYLDSIQSTSEITARRLACPRVDRAGNWAALR